MRKILLLITYCLLFGHAFANEEIPTYTVTVGDDKGLGAIANRFYSQYAGKGNGYLGVGQYIDSIANWNNLKRIKGNPIIQPGQKLYLVNPEIYQKQHGDSQNLEEDNKPSEDVTGQNSGTPETLSSTSLNQQSQTDIQPITTITNEGDDKGRYEWIWLLLGILFGAVLGVFLFNVLYVKKIIEEQERRNTELARKNQTLYREKTSESSELSQLRTKIRALERENQKILNENIALGEEIDRLKNAQSNTNKTRNSEAHSITTSTSQVSNQPSEPSTVLYADAIIDDYFVKVRETPNEDSIFVLQLNGNNSAEFDIYKNAYSKVAANPSYLDGCEKQILFETKQIDIVSKGSAQLMGLNGKWKVVKKLNVIIK